MTIHHIGYLVKKIDKAIKIFEALGYEKGEIIYDDFRRIDLCFLEKDGYVIELVSPRGDSMANLMKRLGNSPYHICYTAANIARASEELISKGFVMCDAPHEAVALENKKVCFFIHPYMGMIELLEGGPEK